LRTVLRPPSQPARNRDRDQLGPAPHVGAEAGGVLGQQADDDGLRDAQDIRVRGVQQVRLRLADAGEVAAERMLPAEREEPVQQTPRVHQLDGARVDAQRAHDLGRLRLLVQHEHLHAVQPQLGGQHHAGRPAAHHDDVEHDESPFSPRIPDGSGWRFCSAPGVLPQAPGCAIR
jgi:hypothetical protein